MYRLEHQSHKFPVGTEDVLLRMRTALNWTAKPIQSPAEITYLSRFDPGCPFWRTSRGHRYVRTSSRSMIAGSIGPPSGAETAMRSPVDNPWQYSLSAVSMQRQSSVAAFAMRRKELLPWTRRYSVPVPRLCFFDIIWLAGRAYWFLSNPLETFAAIPATVILSLDTFWKLYIHRTANTAHSLDHLLNPSSPEVFIIIPYPGYFLKPAPVALGIPDFYMIYA